MQNNSKRNNREKGNKIEALVCEYLEQQGFIILEKNFKCHFGEIDIIAKDNDYISFIEVKYRKNAVSGYPSEAVNFQKQKKIIQSSLYYIHKNRISINQNYRYDVISVLNEEISIIKNAFTI